jgi:hypothetical protein
MPFVGARLARDSFTAVFQKHHCAFIAGKSIAAPLAPTKSADTH